MSFISTASDCEDSEFVRAENIYEGTRYFLNNQLLGMLIVFEHKVYCSSNCLRLHQKYSPCIEIVAYASNVNDHSALDCKNKIFDKHNIEASRLYLCSKKIFKLATLVEDQKSNMLNRKMSRLEGSKYAQNLMIDYILPRIIISKTIVKWKMDLLQIEWSPLASDCDKDASFDDFKVLGQLPHIDYIM